MKKKYINQLIKVCNELVNKFADETGALDIDFKENKKYAIWTIKYRIMKIEFVFTKTNTLFHSICMLFCRIYLRKNDVYFYHISDIIEDVDATDFKCYYYSYIESEERMKSCFSDLQSFFIYNWEKINSLIQDKEKCLKIRKNMVKDVFFVNALNSKKDKQFDISIFWSEDYLNEGETYGEIADEILEAIDEEEFQDEDDREAYKKFLEAQLYEYNSAIIKDSMKKILMEYEENVILDRVINNEGYIEYLKGNYSKALCKYEKLLNNNNCTKYEKRLIEFIEGLSEYYEAMPDSCMTIWDVEEYRKLNNSTPATLISLLITELIMGSLFTLIMFVYKIFLAWGTTYFAGIPISFGYVCAGLPALMAMWVVYPKMLEIIYKSRYKRVEGFEKIIGDIGLSKKIAKILFIPLCIVMLITSILLVSMNTRFYDDRMEFDNGDTVVPFDTTVCYYKDLKKIYHADGVYDGSECYDRENFVFEFENGIYWDSDTYTSVEWVKENVLDIVEPYCNNIKNVRYYRIKKDV